MFIIVSLVINGRELQDSCVDVGTRVRNFLAPCLLPGVMPSSTANFIFLLIVFTCARTKRDHVLGEERVHITFNLNFKTEQGIKTLHRKASPARK